MKRLRGKLGAALILGACTPMGDGNAYDVTLSDSGALALVRPQSEEATIAGIERAARDAAPRGCTAQAAPVLYDLVSGDREAPLPASARLRFAGRLPATLTCG
ncbi:hypothetical protein EU805_08750 [Salipiger sp. IMCC34102]|uniref:hypothetical protein n=1 Tax=Salipiger sp. IMCC34102 TaxID=2510647 RepID=UPI00101D080A|nr:hypothetical protein [Salipiger sp. IMCC34102]RYH02697.1 hypothetical protein EU805_08750 [Salipiger sp. IMCC34102]